MGKKAYWNDADVIKLLEVLKEEKASAGDGGNFKAPTFKKRLCYQRTSPARRTNCAGSICIVILNLDY